jgi:uncharacterized membrane protein YagU involved in acid resistance
VTVEDDDVQLVGSIGGIDGMPLTLDVQSMHMHNFVGASFIVVVSNHVIIVVISNYVVLASNFAKVEMWQLVTIQTQAIAWKLHNQISICWGFFVVNDNLPMDLEKP